MEYIVKNLSARLDKKLCIVPSDSTKDFLAYFDYQCDCITDFVLESERDRFIKLVNGSEDGRSDVFRLLRNTGEYRYNFVSIRNVKDDEGLPASRLRLFDIYDAIEFARFSEDSGRSLRTVLSITNEHLFSYDVEKDLFTIIRYNQGHELVSYKMTLEKWIDQVQKDGFVEKDQLKQLELLRWNLIDNGLAVSFSVKIKSSLRTGGTSKENLRIIGIRHRAREGIFVIGRIVPDETYKSANISNILMDEIYRDSLTRVYNKKAITAFVHRRLNSGLPDSFALAIIDLDFFKQVNDRFGHLIGDRVIERTAKAIKETIGDDGTIGRFGGDEFMVILNDVANEQVLRGNLRAILLGVRREFLGAFEGISLTCSIGCSVYPLNGTTYEDLFKKADFCLYRAKNKGRDRYVFFRDELHLESFLDWSGADRKLIRFETQETQLLRCMTNYVRDLKNNPKEAAASALKYMIEVTGADSISVYIGQNLKRILFSGNRRPEFENVSYIRDSSFLEALGEKSYVDIDFPQDIEKLPDGKFKEALQDRGTVSSIQCIVGTRESLLGLVSVDKIKNPAQWADYEINGTVLFASALSLIDLKDLQ